MDEFIKKNFVNRPPKEYKVIIEFDPITEFNSRNIIELKEVSFGYNNLNNID